VARARARITLKLPEKQLREMIRRYGEDFLPEIPTAFEDASAQALARMIELAPFETGELESSASKEDRTSPRGRRSSAEFSFDTPYAGVVHELPEHSRGEGTKGKPGNEFGSAGPKYIERVLRGFKLAPIVGRVLNGFWRRAGKVG